MALYIGFFKIGQGYMDYVNERLTSGEWTVPATGNLAIANDAQFSDKVRGFPAFLESRGVRLIGAYGSVGFSGLRPEDPPGVTIIETDNDADLGAIPNYYTPYLTYSFYRYNSIPRPS